MKTTTEIFKQDINEIQKNFGAFIDHKSKNKRFLIDRESEENYGFSGHLIGHLEKWFCFFQKMKTLVRSKSCSQQQNYVPVLCKILKEFDNKELFLE